MSEEVIEEEIQEVVKSKSGRKKLEVNVEESIIDVVEELKMKKGRPKGVKNKTKQEKKDAKKVKQFEDKGLSETQMKIRKTKKNKTGIYKYLKITQDMIRDIDEVRLENQEEFHFSNEPYITKAEIVAGSVFRVYVEQELLEEKHVVFLYFYKKCFGNHTRACEKMGINRRTPFFWEENNSLFRGIMEDFKEGFLDDTEEMLKTLISEKNIAAIMFHLKTKGKDRGYTEKNIIELQDKTEVVGFEFVNVNEDFLEAEVEENKLLENNK